MYLYINKVVNRLIVIVAKSDSPRGPSLVTATPQQGGQGAGGRGSPVRGQPKKRKSKEEEDRRTRSTTDILISGCPTFLMSSSKQTL
jgi:hypothetical protein